jgi:hypothetical protein
VNAPAEVNRLHTDFVAALRSFADELPDLSSKIRKDPAAGLGVLLDSKSIQTLLRVSQELGRRGYEIELGSA